MKISPKFWCFLSENGSSTPIESSRYSSECWRSQSQIQIDNPDPIDCYGMRASMGDVGACWDNAVVERFFGSLKHDWLLKVPQATREHMRNDVTAYMRYYNLERLHTANGDLSPVEYEQSSLRKVS